MKSNNIDNPVMEFLTTESLLQENDNSLGLKKRKGTSRGPEKANNSLLGFKRQKTLENNGKVFSGSNTQ